MMSGQVRSCHLLNFRSFANPSYNTLECLNIKLNKIFGCLLKTRKPEKPKKSVFRVIALLKTRKTEKVGFRVFDLSKTENP